ncbi:HU family DNA-binding protein [candidate division KSB1 bacterium]|nr:HU family DNA-binding protein [candidate division KSB1 bacterium]
MNYQEVVRILAERLEKPQKEIQMQIESAVNAVTAHLVRNRAVNIPQVGTFAVRKRKKRKTFNGLLSKYLILPPKIVPVYRPSRVLKEKVKERRIG